MQTQSDTSIIEFVKKVLVHTFSHSRRKQEINEDPDKLNFACPYCGDSDTDLSKKRGNIYYRTNSFKCFNDGCLKWVPLSKFISHFSRELSIPIPTLSASTFEDRKPKVRKGFLIEFLMNPKVKKSLISFKDLSDRFFLKPCKDADPGSPIYEYIKSRHLENLPSFEQSCYYDSREDKIYIFNLDIRSGLVLGVSIRRIDPNYPGPKYDIKNYSQFIKNGLISKIDQDILTQIDTVNNFFNILNINFNKPIIVLEGQINAMFLNNAIATTGVTKSKSVLGSLISKKNALILFDNDKAGKEETYKLLKQGYKVFMWSKLIMNLRLKYPDQRRKINEINDINDLYKFLIRVGGGLDYDDFNNYVMEYFSNSIYDLIWA
jgi:hypothetical protein